jgi:hypothetical protein
MPANPTRDRVNPEKLDTTPHPPAQLDQGAGAFRGNV